jgi:deoxyribonuclease V
VHQPWPQTDDELIQSQVVLARDADIALAAAPWTPSSTPMIGGCFVAFARGLSGRGHPGDEAWAAAVAWRPGASPLRHGEPYRRSDDMLRRASASGPRRASDVADQAVVVEGVGASYTPGLLALRQGPILAAAVAALSLVPDVVLVDATGLDHPRRAGLAVQLGAVLGVPTVGVTHRPLLADGVLPLPVRGSVSPLYLGDRLVGCWVRTRTGARPVVAHAGWRTDADVAGSVVLLASTGAARTPVPLEEARRVAREARSSTTRSDGGHR